MNNTSASPRPAPSISHATKHITRPDFDPAPGEDGSSRLALELAIGLRPAAEVADAYGLSASEVAHRLRDDKAFASQVMDLKRAWRSSLSAKDRVRMKSEVMVEDALPFLWKLLTNPEVHPGVRLDLHKHLTRLADVEPKPQAQEGGSRFSVTINLPRQDPVEVSVNTNEVQRERAAIETISPDDYEVGD